MFDPANEDEEEHLRDFHKVAKLAEKKANRGLRRKRNTTYCFDSVFGPDSTQEQVYQETTADTVETVFSGYNCSGTYKEKCHKLYYINYIYYYYSVCIWGNWGRKNPYDAGNS